MSDFEAVRRQLVQRCGSCEAAWIVSGTKTLFKVTLHGLEPVQPDAEGWVRCCGNRLRFVDDA